MALNFNSARSKVPVTMSEHMKLEIQNVPISVPYMTGFDRCFQVSRRWLSACFCLACIVLCSCSSVNTNNYPDSSSLATANDIYIARTGGACMGSCPDYEIYLFNDGRAIFRGHSYTRVKGTRQKTIPKKDFEDLKSVIEATNFFGQPETNNCITDSPTVWVEANFGKGVQRRFVDFGCVQERKTTWAIVELIDKTASAHDWVEVGRGEKH